MFHSEIIAKPYDHFEQKWHHEVVIPSDDGQAITFKWHWPRGTFDKRMSALEIGAFLLPHMPFIGKYIENERYPRIHAEFEAMLVMLATSPREALDEVLPWIQPVKYTEEDELVVMSLFAKGDYANKKVTVCLS